MGFYEAIDCTPRRRLAARQLYAVVRSFMAHHQGMSLLSLAYLLLDKPMQKYFEQDPSFKATMPLLQERIPKSVVVQDTERWSLQTNHQHLKPRNRLCGC